MRLILVSLLLFGTPMVLSLTKCTACPVGGIWSDWEDHTTCTADCGLKGRKVQNRTCDSWKYGCPCSGPYSRAIDCPEVLCLFGQTTCADGYSKYLSIPAGRYICGNQTRNDDYVAPTCKLTTVLDDCACPPGGLWTAWVSSGPCSASCGLFGTVTQTRTCRSSGDGCPCTGDATRAWMCQKVPCPGSVCTNGYPVVQNLHTGSNECGLRLPADPVLSAPSCPTTTTNPKTTAAPTTTSTTIPPKVTATTTPTTTPAKTTTIEQCPPVNSCNDVPGFVEIYGSCYKMIEVNANYSTARDACKTAGAGCGDLGVLRCDEQNQGALGLFLNDPAINNASKVNSVGYFVRAVWLGYYNITTNITTTTGEPATYTHWQPFAPDNNNGNGGEDCAQMLTTLYSNWNFNGNIVDLLAGDWNDIGCSVNMYAALCEVELNSASATETCSP